MKAKVALSCTSASLSYKFYALFLYPSYFLFLPVSKDKQLLVDISATLVNYRFWLTVGHPLLPVRLTSSGIIGDG